MLSVLYFNVYSDANPVVTNRVTTAWLIFGGVQDIFLAFMMFFVLNDEVTIIRNESTKIAYTVLDVINIEASNPSD